MAKKHIVIENAYFCPPEPIREALCEAARRGVKVRILTNGYESCNHQIVADVMRHYYKEMLEAGVEIYEKQGGTLHSKTASFDDQFSYVGSFNLNARSAELDTECVLAVHDLETACRLEARFEDGAAEAHRVTLDEVTSGSPLQNARSWAIATLLGPVT